MSKKFASDSPSFEEIRRLKNPNRQSCEIILDPRISNEIQELRRKHMIAARADSKQNRTPEAPAIMKKIEALEDEATESTIRFTFQDVGRKRFEESWKKFPPSEEQKEDGYEWDPDAFSPYLLHISAVEPELSLEEAQEIFDEWSTAEVGVLINTALNANMGVASIPLSGTGTGEAPTSDMSLITSLSEESPTPSG